MTKLTNNCVELEKICKDIENLEISFSQDRGISVYWNNLHFDEVTPNQVGDIIETIKKLIALNAIFE